MTRMTRLLEDKGRYVTQGIDGVLDDAGYYGEAVEKLAKFENMVEHLQERLHGIPAELEALRLVGKSKTVTFKELMAEKMICEMIRNQFEWQGIK